MSDIVEIALERFTDYHLFERMACEIMRNEGYPAIKPLGGPKDGGKDAEEKPLYVSEGKRQRTIFQISMEENALKKIRETVRRLNKTGESYGCLVYVTNRAIGTSKQDEIKRKIRKDDEVYVEIFERSTLVNRLADFENGIFGRFFPSIESQVRFLQSKRHKDSEALSSQHEEALLRTSLTLNFGRGASVIRESTFNRLVLTMLIEDDPSGLSEQDIRAKISEFSRGSLEDQTEIGKALEGLLESNQIEESEGKYVVSLNAIKEVDASKIRSDKSLEALVEDVMDMFRQNATKRDEEINEDVIRRNCRDILLDYLRLMGKELMNLDKEGEAAGIYADPFPEIEAKARRQVSQQDADLLVSCVAEMLSKPAPHQSEWISGLSLSYVGAAILGLDPVLRELTAEKLASKVFFLDTDIVITCLIKESPESTVYRSVVQRLANCGAKVVIPEVCLEECVDHARYSHKTYTYFGDRLLALPESAVGEQVWNGFVKGYYYGRKNGSIPSSMSYKKYLRNYYDVHVARPFMEDAVKAVFPQGVTIEKMDAYISEEKIPEEKRQLLEAAIYEELSDREKAKKAEYRSDEQAFALAKTDALLFLSVYFLNSQANSAQSNQIYSGSHYLITTSGRYVRCAGRIDLRGKVTTRLQPLAGVLHTLGRINLTPAEFMQLLDNPFLTSAVRQVREDIEGLVEAGVNLRGVSLPRLRRDLDEGLHQRITQMKTATSQPVVDSDPSTLGDEEYLAVIEDAERLGYGLVQSAKEIMERLEGAKKDYETKSQIIDKYADKVETFGKRKRKHLKQMEIKAKRKR